MTPDGHFITIYRPDVFECFRDGPAGGRHQPDIAKRWFATCLAYQYENIARQHACEITLSATRLEEARLLWMRDSERIDIRGDTTPDHFKQVGFLVYWLRRRMVVHASRRDLAREAFEEQDRFVLAANEICAFLIGLRLTMYFELKSFIDSQDHVGHEIQRLQLDDSLKFDVATLLKHKNVSPHSLYLIYRTLFYDLQRPQRSTPALAFARE